MIRFVYFQTYFWLKRFTEKLYTVYWYLEYIGLSFVYSSQSTYNMFNFHLFLNLQKFRFYRIFSRAEWARNHQELRRLLPTRGMLPSNVPKRIPRYYACSPPAKWVRTIIAPLFYHMYGVAICCVFIAAFLCYGDIWQF